MSPGADVRSLEALPNLATALGRFGERAGEALDEAASSTRRALEQLEDDCRKLAYELDSLQEQYDALSGEEEDSGELLEQINDAQERLHNREQALDRVEAMADAFRRTADRLNAVVRGRIPAAGAFLERKYDELCLYTALAPPNFRGSAPSGAGGTQSSSRSGSGAEGAGDLTVFRLPPGFQWVSLNEVEPTDFEVDDFTKVPADEMARGFRALAEHVLPLIDIGGHGADSTRFGDVDRASGTEYSSGLQRVYDAFFGTDAIRLDRRAGGGVWSVTNGRHRLAVARRLGITHVPARTCEVGQGDVD
jgi:hypothetical protein